MHYVTSAHCRAVAAALLCGLELVLTGCRTPPSAGITVESYQKNSITVNSKILRGWLTVTEVTANRGVNELLSAQVTAQNVTQKDCQFEYRFEWLDKNGMTINTLMTTWVPLSVSAMEMARMRAVAPSKAAEDFVLIVRFTQSSERWRR
ncbi:MAG: YcfL family protein [bacterium]